MKTPDQWERGYAEGLASMYAEAKSRLNAEVAENAKLGEALRQYLDLNGLEALIDGETGVGVELGKAARNTSWDTKSMPRELLLALQPLGILQVYTPAFDALVRAGGAVELDEAKRFRFDGENARPLKVVTK